MVHRHYWSDRCSPATSQCNRSKHFQASSAGLLSPGASAKRTVSSSERQILPDLAALRSGAFEKFCIDCYSYPIHCAVPATFSPCCFLLT